MHKTFVLGALGLVLTAVAVAQAVAQDVPPDATELDTATLVQRYAGSRGDARAALRRTLLEHDADDVRAALAALPFQGTERSGVVAMRTRCPDGHTRPMWVRIPGNYDPATPYPLVVCLHGGVSGAPLYAQGDHPAPGEGMLNAIAANMPAEVVDSVILIGLSAGAQETSPGAVWWALDGQHNILHFINQTKRRFNIDDERVYVTGFSDGASGSFGLAMRMPDAFAGFLPIYGNLLVAGADNTPIWYENLRGQNIRASNGGQDLLYPTRRMKLVIEQANQAGAEIAFTDYPEEGHVFSDGARAEIVHFANSLMPKWQRDLLPAGVDWTAESAARGRRAWLAIDTIADLGDANVKLPNAEVVPPPAPARLGVQLKQDADDPTVDTVVAGTTAQAIGMQAGDVITGFDGNAIESIDDLRIALQDKLGGDKFTIEVLRDGEKLTLEGEFMKASSETPAPPLTARVTADREPGVVTLRVRNASRVSILVAREMLDDDGNLEVRLIDAEGKVHVVREAGPVAADTGVVLDEYDRSGDRKLPWINRIEVDVQSALGAKPQRRQPPSKEDDF